MPGQHVTQAPCELYAPATIGAQDPLPRGIYFGTSGTLVCEDLHGNIVTFLNCPEGGYLPLVMKNITQVPANAVAFY